MMILAPLVGITSEPAPVVMALMLLVNGLGDVVSQITVTPSACRRQLARALCDSVASRHAANSRRCGKARPCPPWAPARSDAGCTSDRCAFPFMARLDVSSDGIAL